MSQPYDPDEVLADPDAHPLHTVYALINKDVRDNGAEWSKCANCGFPYRLSEEWSDGTVCSPRCFRDYTAYVMSGQF